MPENPTKTACTVPGCHAWAMRGHDRCRAHRRSELGSPGGGAPPGNLNALKHGRHAYPLPPARIDSIAARIAAQPADLHLCIAPIVKNFQERLDDPHLALQLLLRVLDQLTPCVARHLTAARLDAYLDTLPPDLRAPTRLLVDLNTDRLGDEARWMYVKIKIPFKNN